MRRRNNPRERQGIYQEARQRNEAVRLRVLKRVAFCLFVGMMVYHIGDAFSIYEQSLKEVEVKEKRLCDLKNEEARVQRRLKYLETPHGRRSELYRQGWIPPGARLLILPPTEQMQNAKTAPRDSAKENLLRRTVNRALKICRQWQRTVASWWGTPQPEH